MGLERSVVIIGGGVMGCAIALRLCSRGLKPLVLERSVPGAEASSAAAGILAPQQEAAGPGPLLELGLESRARFPSLVEELQAATGMDVGFRRSGLVALAGDEAGAAALEEKASWQLARGLRVERLDAGRLRRLEPSLGAHAAGLLFVDEAQVEPPRLMRALQLAAARAGTEFATAYVRRVRHDGERVLGVELGPAEGGTAWGGAEDGGAFGRLVDGGLVAARRVVVAAGSWSGLVEGALLPPQAVRPMRGQLVELETRLPLLLHVVFAPGGYLVPRPDGRVVVGSTMELVGFRKEVTAAGLESLLALARRTVPALADAPVGRFWANFRPYTDDHLPFLGPTPIRGLHLATGHFRNGILLLPITADAVAAAVCDEPPPVDLTPFSVRRLA